MDRAEPAPSFSDVVSDLKQRKVDYNGNMVSVRRNLIASKVLPAWPQVGKAASVDVMSFLRGELAQDMSDPKRCLLPVEEWPTTTPKSKVYASDSEWYDIVHAGWKRGMIDEVPEHDIFRNNLGQPVMAGAMGVDKFKNTREGVLHLLRFISILTPINAYMRKLRGDANTLPYMGQLSLALLEPEQHTIIDSADLENCFNIYRLPREWLRFFTFSKRVSQGAVGGDPNREVFFGLRILPMGFQGSVDVAQAILRELVFGICGVNPATEFRKDSPLPAGAGISILCLDGFDFIRVVSGALGDFYTLSPSVQHDRFVSQCEAMGLPLNAAKRVVASTHAIICGAEVGDGRLSIPAAKAQSFWWKSFGMLASTSWSQAMLLHWTGLGVYVAQFRRPLFCILQEVFHFALVLEETPRQAWLECADEVILMMCLLPLAFNNLKADIRRTISSSDASSHGGGAAEASAFDAKLDSANRAILNDVQARIIEDQLVPDLMHCSVCGGDLAGKSFACPRSCSKFACSLKCIIHHRRDGCCLAQWSAPSFMEIFAETALTEAVALQKVAVQWPDLFGDFRSVDLKSAGVAAEHFWLCGSNMAWCTNRQVDYPLGVPWVQDISTISEMRESNRRLIVALRRLEQRTLN